MKEQYYLIKLNILEKMSFFNINNVQQYNQIILKHFNRNLLIKLLLSVSPRHLHLVCSVPETRRNNRVKCSDGKT